MGICSGGVSEECSCMGAMLNLVASHKPDFVHYSELVGKLCSLYKIDVIGDAEKMLKELPWI